MAGIALQSDVVDLLEKLELSEFYPEKLSRDDLYEITEQSLVSKANRNCSLSWQFINDISRYNYKARNLQKTNDINTNLSKMGVRERNKKKLEQNESCVHPLDTLVIVFLCCEPTARQDLVMHLWGCKLAIPFIIQMSRNEKPKAFVWPLRCLVGQFDDYEMPLVDMKTKTISFIRIGDNENLSKSNLVNCIIGGPEKAHPIFFQRDSEGSLKSRSNVVNGLIEIGWFLPKDSEDDSFPNPRLFLNLRGDAKHLPEQVQIIGDISTITVVVCTSMTVVDPESGKIIRNLVNRNSSVLVLLSDKNVEEDKIITILSKYSDLSDQSFELIDTIDLRLGHILQAIKHNIERIEKTATKKKSLKDIYLSNDISIDEREDQYRSAFVRCDEIIKTLSSVKVDERKKLFLPLQETYWKEWGRLDRDYHRFGQLETHLKEKYGSQKSVGEAMKKVRKKQRKCLKDHKHFSSMEIFLRTLIYMDEASRRIFLRYLKLELDNMSRAHIIPFYKKYYKLLVEKEKVATDEERNEIIESLSQLDANKANISLGLEHFVREMGQVFEACQSTDSKSTTISTSKNGGTIKHDQLPNAACVLLKEGYPLEILDGEAASVPMLWVQRVLAVLPQQIDKRYTLHDPRVHIISVLGIQSSGKSTFLNTLFGLQFSVSAGRCTRGAFIQLVKIGGELKGRLKTDYILAVDTEGLRSAEMSSNEYIKHDNELSTFVIGLADTTVINLMGENATYLQDNLPIVVHAFLRMNLVGLHPRCIIVHHNVDKRNKEKLLQQGHFLETILDSYTEKACEIEKIQHKQFKEIIQFNISEHTDYIPALLEGERPMAPISIGYSSEVDLVRTKLINFVQPSVDLSKLSQFSRHLENLWTAIKRDRFVYEFKTTLETEARINLDNRYFIILDEYVSDLEEVNIRIRRTIDEKKDFQKCIDKYSKETKALEKTYMKKMSDFFKEPKKVISDRISAWEKDYQTNLQEFFEQNQKSDSEDLKLCYEQKKGVIRKEEWDIFWQLYAKFKDKHPPPDEETVLNQFLEQWNNCICTRVYNVIKDTVNALHTVCPAHKHLLSESVILKSFLEQFQPSEAKHINSAGKLSSSGNTLMQKMQNIKQTVLSEYDRELSCIKQKQLPYTHRNPLLLILAVEKCLQRRLKTEDNNNEINNMFRIDILLCTAGSCVKDLEKINKENKDQPILRATLQKLVKQGKDTMDDVTNSLQNIIQTFLKYTLDLKKGKIMKASLHRSKWADIVKDKQNLLGYCLKEILEDNNDAILLQYVNHPVEAILGFLKNSIGSVSRSQTFKEECQNLIELETYKLTELIKSILEKNGKYLSPKMFFQEVRSQMNLHQNNIEIFFTAVEKNKKFEEPCKFDVDNFLRALDLSKMEKMCCEEFVRETQKEESIIALVKTLSTLLIGCQEQCPFCNELCRYSNLHPGKHECYIHRPVGCNGLKWHRTQQLSYETCPQHLDEENRFYDKKFGWVSFRDYEKVHDNWQLSTMNPSEPSLIWKFIFVKKYFILKSKCELPDNLPEEWTLIEKHEALRALENKFRITASD